MIHVTRVSFDQLLFGLISNAMENIMYLCLTSADIGKKFKTRSGKTVTLRATRAGDTTFWKTHPYWLIEVTTSVNTQGITSASGSPGSVYDLVERVCEPTNPFADSYWSLPSLWFTIAPKPAAKSWDSLRCAGKNAGKIQTGTWSTKPDCGDKPVNISANFEAFPGHKYVALEITRHTGFSASGLDQLAEFCTATAKQLRGC